MVITSGLQPTPLQKYFKHWTRLMIQNRTASILTIAEEQGAAQNAGNGGPDGLQFTLANTSPPFQFWWKGELWHVANAANTQWTLVIVGEARGLDADIPKCED